MAVTDDPAALLRAMFDAAVASAQPAVCVPPCLPEAPRGRTVVLGGGKGSAAMAKAIEENWDGPLEGLVVTRYGYGVPCQRIEIAEAAHPVPDAAGERAARRLLEIAGGLGPDDLVIAPISGGGSALLALPAPGITLDDKQALSRQLLASGATITEINCVRRHLSAIKGGRLAAAAAPARVVTILISDVPGDDPADIASGPTVPDPTDFAMARDILRRRGIDPPRAVAAHLEAAAEETPKPGDPIFSGNEVKIAAAPLLALKAAADVAERAGVTPLILGDALEGESRELAVAIAGIARSVRAHGLPTTPPVVLLSGGETTVTIRGDGVGGPNAEFCLSLAIALNGASDIWAAAGDTDGVDGAADVAGAVFGPDILEKSRALGLDPRAALARNDAHGFFATIDSQIVPGPTMTNVNDFRAVLIL